MLLAGQTYRSTLDVYQDGQLTDPATAKVTVTDLSENPPVAVDQVISLPSAQPGHLVFDYLCSKPGMVQLDWVTTGPGTARRDYLAVRDFRSILSLADARAYLDIRDASRDDVLTDMLDTVTRLIERHVGTCVPKVITGARVPGRTRAMIRLPFGPPLAADAVTRIAAIRTGGPSWAAGDLDVDPASGTVQRVDGLPFWGGPWRWWGTAGRAVIPPDVIEGAQAALYDLWATQRGVYADTTEPGLDEVAAYEAAAPVGWQLPPRVMQLISGERVLTGFA